MSSGVTVKLNNPVLNQIHKVQLKKRLC